MTWVDVVLLFLIAVTTYGGYVRGVIQEVFDLLVVGVGLAVALRFFNGLGGLLQDLAGLQSSGALWSAFFLLFVLVAAFILAMGLRMDQLSEDDRSLPPGLKSGLGALLGAIKGVILAWIVLASLHHLPVVDPPLEQALKTAPVVQGVQGLSPTFVGFAAAAAPKSVEKWLIPAVDQRF